MGQTHTPHPAISKVSLSLCKVHVQDRVLKDQILAWPGCKLHCVYLNRAFTVVAWDLLVPSALYREVARLCRLSRPSRHSSGPQPFTRRPRA